MPHPPFSSDVKSQMTGFMASKMEERDTHRGQESERARDTETFNNSPLFYDKIKSADLIKLRDTFVKLKKVFDVR